MRPSNIPPVDLTGPPAEEGARTSRFTVLIGNDPEEGPWYQNVRGLLGAQGVETLVATTGRQALGLIEDSARGSGPQIHVAVLDQRLPVMGGLQILRRLQQDLAQKVAQGQLLPPTILLADSSARGLASNLMHEALMARVFSVLPKPIELDLLLDTLARALKRHYQNKWPGESRQ